MSVFHFLLITLKLKVDDLDFEDGNVDNEKSDEYCVNIKHMTEMYQV